MHASLTEIAALIEGTIIGDEHTMISSLSPIDNILQNALIFAEGEDNIKKARESNASAVLVSKHVEDMNKPMIQVTEPFKAFIQLLSHFHPQKQPEPFHYQHQVLSLANSIDYWYKKLHNFLT